MKYVQLGRSGLSVSRICLGTMNFGPVTDRPESYAIMDAAHAAGINLFDTADVYGWDENRGLTETIIGEWFAQGNGRRDRTVLATKLYGDWSDWPNHGRLSALHIRRACDASLRRLQSDYIDVYQMHHVAREVPWEEIWEAMDVLRQQGKILYVGTSNFAGWHLAQGQETAWRGGRLGLVSEQSVYNLFRRDIELEVIPAAQAYGIGIIPWSPLHGGLLGGVLRRQESGDVSRSTSGRAADALAVCRPAIEQWEELCDEVGQAPGEMALAWLLHRDGVTAPIVGPRTPAQLDSGLRALEIQLDDAVLARIDEIFPGPGGPAPEAYAW